MIHKLSLITTLLVSGLVHSQKQQNHRLLKGASKSSFDDWPSAKSAAKKSKHGSKGPRESSKVIMVPTRPALPPSLPVTQPTTSTPTTLQLVTTKPPTLQPSSKPPTLQSSSKPPTLQPTQQDSLGIGPPPTLQPAGTPLILGPPPTLQPAGIPLPNPVPGEPRNLRKETNENKSRKLRAVIEKSELLDNGKKIQQDLNNVVGTGGVTLESKNRNEKRQKLRTLMEERGKNKRDLQSVSAKASKSKGGHPSKSGASKSKNGHLSKSKKGHGLQSNITVTSSSKMPPTPTNFITAGIPSSPTTNEDTRCPPSSPTNLLLVPTTQPVPTTGIPPSPTTNVMIVTSGEAPQQPSSPTPNPVDTLPIAPRSVPTTMDITLKPSCGGQDGRQ